MLVPRTFTNSLFDEFFGAPALRSGADRMMRTDIKEKDSGYELTIDMPGVSKDDIKAELDNGYLTVSADTDYSNDEKGEDGKYICRERYSGSYSRSFYVGEGVTQEDINAKFDNGTLKLFVPKKDVVPEKQTKYIAID